MTSDELAKHIAVLETPLIGSRPSESGVNLIPYDTPSRIEVDHYRATLEVAYQLAILNEQIGGVLNSRIPQIRVRIENGDYPISTKEVR